MDICCMYLVFGGGPLVVAKDSLMKNQKVDRIIGREEQETGFAEGESDFLWRKIWMRDDQKSLDSWRKLGCFWGILGRPRDMVGMS